MKYCARCVYPANAKPGIMLDEFGVCSGCKATEGRYDFLEKIDWLERERRLSALLSEYKAKQRAKNNPYDCIIPVSGGKDSTYQVWLLKIKYGLNPLCVSYNHSFNTPRGIRNLANLLKTLDVNLIRYTTAPGSAIRIAKYMLRTVGDVTWHYHAGIMTFPIQAAVHYDVPLIVWGEEPWGELTGMFNLDDWVEFTKKQRQEHSMRGFEPEDLLDRPDCSLSRYDLAPFFYPPDELIESVGVRGIYLSNYMPWDGRAQAEFVIRELNFETAPYRERTFNTYAKLDDIHANGLHDYLKYLKFGYGRATDDASLEIRLRRMTREEGIQMVARYDHVRPSDMDVFLNAAGMSEDELLELIAPMRDPAIWVKGADGAWQVNDSVANHLADPGVEAARLPPASSNPQRLASAPRSDLRFQSDEAQTHYVVL